jgi:hypothetical protein
LSGPRIRCQSGFQSCDYPGLLDRLRVDVILRRLCGWETARQAPDQTVFSRAFAEFAGSEFPRRIHATLVERTYAGRLVGHIVRDSTAIEAREKPAPKTATTTPPPRHRKGSKKSKTPEQMTRLERQCSGAMSVEQMWAEVPRACDVGCKTNSKGRKVWWVGYEFHLDVADSYIPISAALTSASLNDTRSGRAAGSSQRATCDESVRLDGHGV